MTAGDESVDRQSALPGVHYGTIARHVDGRGSFRELWRAADFPDARFVQGNLSTSDAGVLRGLHLHRRQDDLWVVASGRAFVALVDVRPLLDASGGGAVIETRELPADSWVYIPTGVAHGFLASSRSSSSTWSRTPTTARTSSASPGTIRPSGSPGPCSRERLADGR